MLKPDTDELRLDFSYAIYEPAIQFIVDDKVIETTDTYPNINVSNNKPHTIGVNVSHLLETNEDAPIKVKFEYAWTDVWKLGSQGSRMKEEGFGRYNLSVTNTIVVDGPQHERTTTSSYSKEDYGDGYYLLEIYGYYVEKSGGMWKLFYKSASTAIAVNDSERTTDTAYCFDVITSDPSYNSLEIQQYMAIQTHSSRQM